MSDNLTSLIPLPVLVHIYSPSTPTIVKIEAATAANTVAGRE